jgi:[histone H3]-lysine9 N-trimethyltransferase SUV39H
MSPTPKKRKRHSPTEKQGKQGDLRNGNTNGKGAKRMSTVEEMERLKAIYKQYLESSDDESELSIDAWEEGEYEIDKIVDESVDMCGYHKYAVLQTPRSLHYPYHYSDTRYIQY